MGLRVWLPLNGSLENQGLENISGTNVDATTNTVGKIGSCYSFNGTSARIGFPSTTWTYPLSMCAWIKCNNATDSNTEYIGSYNTATGGTAGHNIGFGIYQGKLSLWHGGSVNQYTTALSNGIWYHVTAVVTSTSYTLYLNGISVLSGNTTQSNVNSCFLTLGARSNNASGGATGALYFFNGYINDFRLYDHALSVKEVRELARGLMVHYKLDMDQSTEPTTNLGGTSINYSNMTYGNAYGASTWGGDAGTVTYYATGGFNNGPYKVYHKTATGTGGIYKKTANDITITSGKTYTVSAYIKASRSFTESHYGFNINGVAGSDSNHYITSGVNLSITTEWKRFSFTFTATDADAGTYGEMSIIYNDQVTDYYVYYSCFQIEEKDHATDFTLNSRTLKVTDDSGFHYHGTPINTLTLVDDTPRYNRSTYFNTTASKISLPAISFSGTSTTYTFAWWQYMVNTARMAWGFSNGNRLNVYYSNPICWNTGDGTSTPFQDGTTTINPSELLNSWHHIAVTGDGAAAKIYIDGVYRGTSKTWRAITGTQIYISGWDTGTNYTWSGGKLSDFRIYATALTAADVADLYHTSAEIDRNGNYYSREVIEK